MKSLNVATGVVFGCFVLASAAQAGEREVTRDQLLDKANAFWVGQLVGNYLGLPFENSYRNNMKPL